jgi:hypothetical protein
VEVAPDEARAEKPVHSEANAIAEVEVLVVGIVLCCPQKLVPEVPTAHNVEGSLIQLQLGVTTIEYMFFS